MDCRGQSRAATRPAPQGRSSPISRTTSSRTSYRSRRHFYMSSLIHFVAPPSKTASPRSCRASSTTSARPCADAGFVLEKTRRGRRIGRDDSFICHRAFTSSLLLPKPHPPRPLRDSSTTSSLRSGGCCFVMVGEVCPYVPGGLEKMSENRERFPTTIAFFCIFLYSGK